MSQDAATPDVALPRGAARLLDEALRALLSPLAHENALAWRAAVRRPLLALADADTLGIHLPFLSPEQAWDAPHLSPARLGDFVGQYQHRDLSEQRIATRGFEVAHQLEVVDLPTLHASAFYNEFQRPHRLFDTVYVHATLDGEDKARLWFTRERERNAPPDPGRMTMLRLVAPALRAGADTWRRVGARRGALASLLDRMADGVLLYNLAGVLLHANAHAESLLADDPEAQRVRGAAQQAAWAAGSTRLGSRGDAGDAARRGAAVTRDVQTARRGYRVEATLVDDGVLGRDAAAMVLLRPLAPAPLGDESLRARYGLTPQETVVTRLLAEGRSDREVAERLGISHVTARNHSARVLQKLGVGRRTRVATLLAGTPSDPLPSAHVAGR